MDNNVPARDEVEDNRDDWETDDGEVGEEGHGEVERVLHTLG